MSSIGACHECVSAWIISVSTNIFFLREYSSTRTYAASRSVQSLLLLQPKTLLNIFIGALVVGVLHWLNSIHNMSGKILSVLRAHAPDKDDAYHKKFENIINEVSVATGGRKIESVILPVSAMNAFSVADFRGRAVIGVTEGLLSRLNRAQLEAVVAHETAHIVSNDAFINTVAVSLFGIYGALLEKIQGGLSNRFSLVGSRRGRYSTGAGRFGAYFIFMYVVLTIVNALGKLISSFLSRACEYRADAVAVRLVRDPYSLAQSLHLINKKWRGSGLGYGHLQSIFIVNPELSALDEQEGFFANLFSTHPPTAHRLRILLDMAHTDFNTLDETEFVKRTHSDAIVAPSPQHVHRWFIHNQGAWQGPFPAVELVTLGFFKNDQFVRKEGEGKVTFAYEHPEFLDAAKNTSVNASPELCPRCYQGLSKIYYENAPAFRCHSCEGMLVEHKKISRILLRQERGFSQEVVRKAKIVTDTAKKPYAIKNAKFRAELKCPRCAKKMTKQFYSLVYLIEVDRCPWCGLMWFDKDELEILQYLVEKADKRQLL